MKRKLVVLSEIIAPYRIPVFNALAKHERIDLPRTFFWLRTIRFSANGRCTEMKSGSPTKCYRPAG